MPKSDRSELLATYLSKRADLRRFFAARMGSGEQAEDLVQELYLKVIAAGDPPDLKSPVAFLYRLASNVMLDRVRAQRRSMARDDGWYRNARVGLPADVEDAPDPGASLDARQTLTRLIAALETLPPQTQRIFKLHKFDGLSHPEVAAKLGISRSAVEKHVSAALKQLMTLRNARD